MRLSIIAAIVCVPVLACIVAPIAARADGGSGGAQACDSASLTACDVVAVDGGNRANLSAPAVDVYGYDTTNIGGNEVTVSASDALVLHGDTSAAMTSFGTVTIKATGNVDLFSVIGNVTLQGCALSIDGAGYVRAFCP